MTWQIRLNAFHMNTPGHSWAGLWAHTRAAARPPTTPPAEADIDGFNLVRLVEPENLEAIVDLLVPELQARSLFKTEYAPGPLRQKLTGRPRLPDSHPGARHRFPTTAEQEPTA